MLTSLEKWGSDWQMLFNMDKCHIIHAGRTNPKFQYNWGDSDLVETESEKDVGVMVTANLKPKLQCARAAKKANMVLGRLAMLIQHGHPTTKQTRRSLRRCSRELS